MTRMRKKKDNAESHLYIVLIIVIKKSVTAFYKNLYNHRKDLRKYKSKCIAIKTRQTGWLELGNIVIPLIVNKRIIQLIKINL